MEYNTQLPRMIIPEYGRNIQNMINHCIKIEDKEERNRCAKAIIQVMGQLNPHLRDVADFTHKLWDHLFIISDFKLDVDSPYPIPEKSIVHAKPLPVSYPTSDIHYKYYGKVMEDMIRKVTDLEDSPKKEQIIQNLANFMKMSYLTWNKDTVDDATIFKHMEELTEGAVKLHETVRLNHTNEILALSKEKQRDNHVPKPKTRQQMNKKNNNNNNNRRKK